MLTAGYNGVINQRQFQFGRPYWPTDYRHPDEVYRDHHTLEVGGETWELHHDKGETDDATWVWNPGRKVLCTGDLFIWASPNCGNPQKVQRYPREWAIGLRKMADLGAEVLLPGHGFPILGADRIEQACTDAAELLESLVEQTLALMNEGARLDDIVATVKAPDHLLEKPYLRPVYDEPEFVVRNLWRLYGGWYDGNPARLKPPTDAAIAAEMASLAGGAATAGRAGRRAGRRRRPPPGRPPRRAGRPGRPRRRRRPPGARRGLRPARRRGAQHDVQGRLQLGPAREPGEGRRSTATRGSRACCRGRTRSGPWAPPSPPGDRAR